MKSVVDHLSELIRIPSPSAVSNRPLVDYASAFLRGIGWSARELTYRDAAGVEKVNLIAAPPGQDVNARDVDLVFMCHTDTVPFASDWENALKPILDAGMLRGCGACDVKGFLACLLTAATQTSRTLDSLRIVLSAEEEIGCIGASRLVEQNVLRPRRMVIGEPTSLQPARAGKGYCLAEVTVFGKEAHSAYPAQGVSAIFHAGRLIRAIEDLGVALTRDRHDFFDPACTTVNIGIIEGGTAKNIVPGLCRFQLEWRPIPGQPPDRVLSEVTQMMAQLQRVDPAFRAEARPVRRQPGFETSADAPLVRRLESLSGKAAVSIPFGSEASIFAPMAEEIIVFGPGDMRTAHSSRECVPLAELEEAVRCVIALMTPDSESARATWANRRSPIPLGATHPDIRNDQPNFEDEMKKTELAGELISEAVAVFIIIAFGDSVAAMYSLYDPSPYQHAYWGVCIAWGLAVAIAIYTTGSVSGCHANPAVTLALALYRKFSWKKVLPYCAAQVIGGFVGAIIVKVLFGPVIDAFNLAHHLTRAQGGAAGVFFTHPGLGITVAHAFSDEIILTAFLIFGIFAITEQFNEMAPGPNFGALIIGLLVALIGASMGYLEAWAINPARDFGPRLFCLLAGWGPAAFPSPENYWWVPIVGPLIGGAAGGGAYQLLIHPFLPARRRALLEEPR